MTIAGLKGLYKLSVADRQRRVAQFAGTDAGELADVLNAGGLSPGAADKVVENALGVYALPFGVGVHVQVNGRDYAVPMVIEEPSVIAAASNAAKMIRASGGVSASVDPPIMVCQVQLHGVDDQDAGRQRLLEARAELLELANRAVPRLVQRGGGARDIEVRLLAHDMLVVHVLVDCRDAMGANLVNEVAEALAPRIGQLGGGVTGLRILSNLADRRCVVVRCDVRAEVLATPLQSGWVVASAVAEASRFAEVDPYRAATHNKGIFNGIDAVCIATGNDWRAVEAGAHAYAARDGQYAPLAVWRVVETDDGPRLRGTMKLPMALGTVGGTLRVHPAAQVALRILGIQSAQELACVAAAVGMCSNLAALRALATEGIQRGHMSLHARSVAVAAGATGSQVERVAELLIESKDVSTQAAVRALENVRLAEPQHARF